MFPFLKLNLSGRSHSAGYGPLNEDSDGDSRDTSRLEKTQVVMKLHGQIRLLAICTALLLVTLILFVSRDIIRLSTVSSTANSLSPSKLLLAPEFPLVTKIYQNAHLIKGITEEVEQRWEADMPRGRGFVRVPTGHTDADDDIYTVSVFHQLHCLYMMQQSFTKAIRDPSGVPEKEVYHTYHCAELLRQALKCQADPTLDPTVRVPDSPTGRGTSGWNGTHVCRDFDRLFEWVEDHRSNDRVGAGIVDGHHG